MGWHITEVAIVALWQWLVTYLEYTSILSPTGPLLLWRAVQSLLKVCFVEPNANYNVCFIILLNTIGAEPPTNVTAVQNGLESVMVSWTPPSSAPTSGYRVKVTPGGHSMNAQAPSQTIQPLEPGAYNIKVISLSHNKLPSEEVAAEVTVNGKLWQRYRGLQVGRRSQKKTLVCIEWQHLSSVIS